MRDLSSPTARDIASGVEETLGYPDNFAALSAHLAASDIVDAFGIGTSYTLALFLERLATGRLPIPVKAYRSSEYAALPPRGGNRATIAVSQSARHDDFVRALAGASEGRPDPVLVTACDDADRLTPPHRILKHAGETSPSPLNVRGPCAALALIIQWLTGGRYDYAHYLERLHSVCEQLPGKGPAAQDVTWVGLLSPAYAVPLAHELNVKLAEVAIPGEAHDIVEFLFHGLCNRALETVLAGRDIAFLTIELDDDDQYIDALPDRLRSCPMFRLKVPDTDPLSAWQMFAGITVFLMDVIIRRPL